MPNWIDSYDDDDYDPYHETPRRNLKYANKDEVCREQTYPEWNGQPVMNMETDHILAALSWCDRKYADMIRNYETAHGTKEGFYFNNIVERFPEYQNLLDELNNRRKE